MCITFSNWWTKYEQSKILMNSCKFSSEPAIILWASD